MPISRHLSIWGIIAVCGLVFAAEQVRETSFADWGGAVPAHLHAAANDLLAGRFSADDAHAAATLVTHIFLHGSVEHIFYNMIFLYTFGVLTSDLLGQWRTLAIFLITGICGGILHVALQSDSAVPMIGASGAISGLVGTYLGLTLRWQLPEVEVWPLAYAVPPMQLGLVGVVGFLGDLLLFANHDQHIAYGAHLGGFLSGLLIAAIITTIYPTPYAYERSRRKDCI